MRVGCAGIEECGFGGKNAGKSVSVTTDTVKSGQRI
jgi:hypothetical protein